jgi:hypothetical protein
MPSPPSHPACRGPTSAPGVLTGRGLSAPSRDARPADVVAAMCGAHAQVLSAAELSVGLRIAGSTRTDGRHALWTDRSLVKTFGPRGTVHLRPPATCRCGRPRCLRFRRRRVLSRPTCANVPQQGRLWAFCGDLGVRERGPRHDVPSPPAIHAGERASNYHKNWWSGAGRTADLPLFRCSRQPSPGALPAGGRPPGCACDSPPMQPVRSNADSTASSIVSTPEAAR